MTDNEIIKALECCRDDTCVSCPICTEGLCNGGLHKNTLDLINRQKAEILELQKRIINWRADMDYRPDEIKSEAIKEFAKRLKENYYFTDRWGKIIPKSTVDSLIKEMTEGKNE